MQEGPFRMPRSTDRSANSRPAVRHVEESKSEEERPKPVQHQPVASHGSAAPKGPVNEKKSFKRFIISGAVVAVIVIVIAAAVLWPKSHTEAGTIAANKYQAVSFTDGQLYFGKLTILNDEYMVLKDVYYLQPQADETGKTDNLQKSTNNQNFKLVKFTDVVYGPEDEMTIPKHQVLFYENINPQGKVAQLIKQYNTSH